MASYRKANHATHIIQQSIANQEHGTQNRKRAKQKVKGYNVVLVLKLKR